MMVPKAKVTTIVEHMAITRIMNHKEVVIEVIEDRGKEELVKEEDENDKNYKFC